MVDGGGVGRKMMPRREGEAFQLRIEMSALAQGSGDFRGMRVPG